jgi:hypothetical protein
VRFYVLSILLRIFATQPSKTPRQVLSGLAETTDPELEADRYGQGDIIARFEGEVAALLGKFEGNGTRWKRPPSTLRRRQIPGFVTDLLPPCFPGSTLFELTVGEATLDLSSQEIVELFQMWLMWVRA